MPRRVRLGLIGADIQRSKSPALHIAEGAAQGLDLSYELIDLTARGLGPEALPELLAEAEAAGFAGLNITHPCKQRVIPLLDALSPDADDLGAVNTVVFADGRRTGHNTDWSGFTEGFRRQLPEAALGSALGSALQMGAGGAGAAVAHATLKLGVGRLLLADIDPARAAALAQALNARAGRDFAEVTADPATALAGVDGLINTTPMGMDAHPGLPLDLAALSARHWVAEIVYFPLETALLAAARAKGCRVADGGGMAVFQAVEAFRLFTGLAPDANRMLAAFRRLTGN